jgi:S-formylglutathione hydrolase FrmB
MESYVGELRALLDADFDGVDARVASVCGHSMGGHGALTLAIKAALAAAAEGGGASADALPPFRSASAFSPICRPQVRGSTIRRAHALCLVKEFTGLI